MYHLYNSGGSESSINDNENNNLKSIRRMDMIRKRNLLKLQKEMFINPKRPPDSTYNINVTLSEKIPLERSIPDTRPEGCSTQRLSYDISKMPTTSVIIIFYNEALSMILRTVHSILKTTPPTLLADIILVDDSSTNEDLSMYLEKYVKNLPKVHLLRTKHRLGLVKARLLGFENSLGKFVFFQDAHTEANDGWLEPLLDEIAKNPQTVIQPYVDEISTKTIEYRGSTGLIARGGFSWDLRYTWMAIPDHELKRLDNLSKQLNLPAKSIPFNSATLVGCAFGVLRSYFNYIGTFDDDYKIWGGENIELAFRVWQCHGRVLTHPCSRVGHTFKPFAYKFGGDREKIVQKNLMRLAENWMDDYAKFFYAITYAWLPKRTYLTDEETSTLNKRLKLRKELKCKSFRWYLNHVAPEINIPPIGAKYFGEIFNMKTESCWYVTRSNYIGITHDCYFHRTVPENEFTMLADKRVYYGDKLIRLERDTMLLYVSDENVERKKHENGGDDDEVWVLEHNHYYTGKLVLYLKKNNIENNGKPSSSSSSFLTRKLCATQVTNVFKIHYKEQMVQMLECEREYQDWRWTYRFDWQYKFDREHAVRENIE